MCLRLYPQVRMLPTLFITTTNPRISEVGTENQTGICNDQGITLFRKRYFKPALALGPHATETEARVKNSYKAPLTSTDSCAWCERKVGSPYSLSRV